MASEETKEILQTNYLEYLKERRLMGSKCNACGNVNLPPRKICSKCHSTDTSWADMTGETGTLSTFSCVSVGTQRFVDRGYGSKNPYAFGIVSFSEGGPSLTGLLQGVDTAHPESIQLGMKMHPVFIETETPNGTQVDIGFEPVEPVEEA